MSLFFRYSPSPNFNERKPDVPLRYIVLHYTGMNTPAEWVKAVCDPATELSAHYLIEENGRVVQLVDEAHRAWHAGKSFWRGITDMNSASIGIELANPGHENGYKAYSLMQIAAVKEMVRDIVRRRKLDPRTCLLGHSDIAPTRKSDPGERFPWRELAQDGLGLWPEPQEEDAGAFDEREATVLLSRIGYDVRANVEVKAALQAFQRRYHPEGLNGKPDSAAMAKLRALERITPPSE